MNSIKLLRIWFGIIPMLVQAQKADNSPCIHIQGVLIDYATHRPLDAARLSAKTSNGRFNVSISGDSGRFSGALPCGTINLLVELANYRSQTIPIRQPPGADLKSLVVLIPLVPVDKQNRDTPYLQTEQTSYVQQDSSDNQAAENGNHVQHGTFLITDAIQKKPLLADVCFFYTKTGVKRCLKTNTKGWLRVDFNQQDIVAMEVSSAGYQLYAGNLIVQQLDGRSLQHEIRMQRELTLFTVHAPGATHGELRTKTRTFSLVPMPENKGRYVAYDLLPGDYEMIVSYQTREVRRPVQLSTGLNAFTVAPPRTNPVVVASRNEVAVPNGAITGPVAKPVLMLPDSIPMIYFEQGSYQLRPDSQAILRQVVSYLKGHPTYTLQIIGHTDNIGNPQINQSLSKYRALVTATFLTRQGVSDSQLIKDGVGSSQPMVPNDVEANRALNRRVSLKLIMAR